MSYAQESQTRVINIEGFSPDLIDTMIHYIYSGGGTPCSTRLLAGVINTDRGATDLEIAKVEQAKDESLLSCYVKAWSAADFFLLESMKQDCVDGLKKSCEQDINVTTDLKAKLPLSKQRPILKKLADGVATAYHHHPHAEPCQSVLVNFAFASRLFFMGMDNFRNLIEQERDFGHGFYVKLMRSRDFQYFGRLDPTSLTTFVDNQCRSCQRVYAYAGGCFHIFDDKKGTSKSDPVIRWKCGLCKQRDKQANVVRIELCEQ